MILNRDSTTAIALRTLPDILAKELRVVFCGINPGMRAAASGHHFMGTGNRFWRVLHLAGFTPAQLPPENDRDLLQYRCGLTTVVDRPTVRARDVANCSASVFRSFGVHSADSPPLGSLESSNAGGKGSFGGQPLTPAV